MTTVLPLAEARDPATCGGKAAALAVAGGLGLTVPPGIVLTVSAHREYVAAGSVAIPSDVRRAIASFAEGRLPDRPLIVRSSAAGEDSARASFAGVLESVGGARTLEAVEEAVRRVWASASSPRSLAYQRTRGVRLGGIAVLVQEEIPAEVAGVLFTRAPAAFPDAADGDFAIEYVRGPPADLVAGRVDPGRLVVRRDGRSWRAIGAEGPWSAGEVAALASAGRALESAFGGPQDVEWAFDAERRLHVLQSRPITAGEARRIRWSNTNLNENFPDPVSPLLYSIAREGYRYLFRNVGRAFGLSARRLGAVERPLRHLVGAHGGRLYYNLTHVHAALRATPFGGLLGESFDTFVGAERHAADGTRGDWRGQGGRPGRAIDWIRFAGAAAWQYLFLGARIRSFERIAEEFAARTRPEDLAGRALEELAADFDAFLDLRFHRWKDASLADVAAMVSFAATQRFLAPSVAGGEGAGLAGTLLKGLPGLASADPTLRLWDLSRLVRAGAELRRLIEGPSDAAWAAIRRDPSHAAFRGEFERFLEDWGFRRSGELMLTVPSFQEEPARALEILRTYAQVEGPSPREVQERQDADRRELAARLARGFPFGRALVFRVLLAATHRAIALRERVRLQQARVYSRCRRIALEIGERLAGAGTFASAGDVFLLSWRELDDLLAGTEMYPYDVRDRLERRRAEHARLATMAPPPSFDLPEGRFLPPGPGGPPGAGTPGEALRGLPAGGGTGRGRARCLSDVAESGRLAPGDVLVARQTDPGWGPVFFLLGGLVLERGGLLSHGAILAREYGVPTVVGVPDATARIEDGARVEVDGDRGVVRLLDP